MTKTKQKSITFKLINIELAESVLNLPNTKGVKPEKFNFNINIEHRFIIEKKLVAVYVDIKLVDEDYNMGSIKVGCIFQIEDFDKYISKDKTNVDLPEDIRDYLNSISVSTTRGVMFTHFRGTHLHAAILPVVSPKDFYNNNIN